MVDRPPYYTDGGIETIDFIEAKGLEFCLGNAVKYISRAGKKDKKRGIEDLMKAIWYLGRRILELAMEADRASRTLERCMDDPATTAGKGGAKEP